MFYECTASEVPFENSNTYENDVNDDDDIFNYSKYETTTRNDYYHLTCLDNNNKINDIGISNNQNMTKAHSTTNLHTVNTLCALENSNNNKYGSMNFDCVSKNCVSSVWLVVHEAVRYAFHISK